MTYMTESKKFEEIWGNLHSCFSAHNTQSPSLSANTYKQAKNQGIQNKTKNKPKQIWPKTPLKPNTT